MNDKKQLIPPLHCWGLYIEGLNKTITKNKKEHDLKVLHKLKQRYNWTQRLDEVLNTKYETLILTDNKQIIEWVNRGFKNMTGYPASYTIGKKPNFLQGQETSASTSRSISKKIHTGGVIKDVVVNYKKSGEKYNCALEIHPLTNPSGQITHFLALENEV